MAPNNPFLLALCYIPLNPSQPLRETGSFYLNPELGVLLYEGRTFDSSKIEDMEALAAAQAKVQKSHIYKLSRLRTLPVHYLARLKAIQDGAETQAWDITAEAAKACQARLTEAAEKAACATPEPEPDDRRSFAPVETEAAEESGEGPLESQDSEDVPPYEEWPLEDLKAEAERRGLVPTATAKNVLARKNTWIRLLEADDEKDGVTKEE